jgi:RNA polymerase sigma-54 factor
LIENLELLARRDFKSLKKICGVEEADLLDMMAEIRALDPKPGTQFELSGSQTIVPDVFVSEQSSGEWHVEMNTQTLPKVLVDQAYYATVTRDLKKSSPDYDFMNECLQSANWLSRSLDQRAKTIIKVASEIVRQQDAFFVKGVSHLKPLNLKNVAEAIGMHESTISRVTSQKYMMTPRGLFEFKYFFTVSLGSGEGSDAHSAEAIRHRIKVMIDAESTKNILSDDDIVKVLKADKVEIARRTVAKYRESMNIASSVQRRREKKLRAQSEATKISA